MHFLTIFLNDYKFNFTDLNDDYKFESYLHFSSHFSDYNGASQRCLSFWPDSESVLRKLRS